MKVILLMCFIIFGMINLSIQRAKITGNCSNHTHVIESLKNECLLIRCRKDNTIKVQSCCMPDRPCEDDGFLQIRRSPKHALYPKCCPIGQCVH